LISPPGVTVVTALIDAERLDALAIDPASEGPDWRHPPGDNPDEALTDDEEVSPKAKCGASARLATQPKCDCLQSSIPN